MKRTLSVLLVVSLMLTATRCIEQPVYDEVPEIEFSRFNKTFLNPTTDSLLIEFSFTDGDGDIGSKDNDEIMLHVVDRRTNFPYAYKVPYVDLRGSSSAISGLVWITLEPGSYSCRPNRPVQDTVSYRIHLIDREGNESNKIITPPVILNCQ